MKIVSVQGDIVKFRGDAIVNAANVAMLGGGGVDGAIQRAAGPQLKAWIRANVPIIEHDIRLRTGDATITDGFNLRAKYIIHTVGPMFHDSATVRDVAYGGEIMERASLKDIPPRDLLKKSIRSCLEVADANDIKTLAIPAISCGVFGGTVSLFAKVLAEVAAEKEWGVTKLWVVLFQDWEMEEFRQVWDFVKK